MLRPTQALVECEDVKLFSGINIGDGLMLQDKKDVLTGFRNSLPTSFRRVVMFEWF